MAEERLVDSPPEGLGGWRRVWSEDRRFPSADRGLQGALFGFLRRLFRRASREDAERQRNFNLAMLEMLEDQLRETRALREQFASQLRQAQQWNTTELKTVVERNDALLSAVDRKAETALARIRDLVLPSLAPQGPTTRREDWLYRRLEEGLRGSSSEVEKAMAEYLPLLDGHQPVVDVGCGGGELLALCREKGIDARGYDTNERSVAALAAKGLDVALGAVPDCLAPHPPESLGAIVATHVVEHLPTGALIELFAAARRVLRPGGLLVIETPNAESLAMSGSDFWRDPTHLAPRHAAALVLLAREYQFGVHLATTVHPYPASRHLEVDEGASPEVAKLAAQIDAILFGDQDLRLVLERK
ncbi:MAG TPA: class I SAM-dependent methyltransferase [Thermoanaerobaculia bacterium]|nr:class I SAM-dependent methyltransferase [Thermoanaerobaculia bacterium]